MPAPVPPSLADTSYALPAGRYTFTTPDEDYSLVFDTEAYDFHVDASSLLHPTELRELLDSTVYAFGYELLTEDECYPEVLDNGMTRIYLAPLMPTEDLDPHAPPAVPVHETRRWATFPVVSLVSGLGFAAAATMCGALYNLAPVTEVLS